MEELEQQRNQQKEEPLMEVNWEEIDKKYVEVPTYPVRHSNYSPQLADDTTVAYNSSVPDSLSPMLVRKGLETQRPDGIDEGSPSFANRNQLLQKPDCA